MRTIGTFVFPFRIFCFVYNFRRFVSITRVFLFLFFLNFFCSVNCDIHTEDQGSHGWTTANEITFSLSTVNGRMAPVVAEISRYAGLWLWPDSTSYLPSKRPLVYDDCHSSVAI